MNNDINNLNNGGAPVTDPNMAQPVMNPSTQVQQPVQEPVPTPVPQPTVDPNMQPNMAAPSMAQPMVNPGMQQMNPVPPIQMENNYLDPNAMGPGIPKKSKLPVIIVGIIVIVAIAAAVVFLPKVLKGNGTNNNNNKNKGNEINTPAKQTEYFNSSNKDQNMLGLSIDPILGDINQNIFMGIKYERAAADLKVIGNFSNSKITLDTVGQDEINFTLDGIVYAFDIEPIVYDSANKTFNDGKVEYNENNYIIIEKYGKYVVYYIYDYKNADLSTLEGLTTINTFEIEILDTLDQAKERINKLNEIIEICEYSKDDLSDCKNAKGEIVDVKKYRYFKDMIIELLNKEKLYIDSYKDINSLSSDYVTLIKTINDKKYEIGVELVDKRDEEQKIELNGMTCSYTEDHLSYIFCNNLKISIMPSGGETLTKESQNEIIKKVFS